MAFLRAARDRSHTLPLRFVCKSNSGSLDQQVGTEGTEGTELPVLLLPFLARSICTVSSLSSPGPCMPRLPLDDAAGIASSQRKLVKAGRWAQRTLCSGVCAVRAT